MSADCRELLMHLSVVCLCFKTQLVQILTVTLLFALCGTSASQDSSEQTLLTLSLNSTKPCCRGCHHTKCAECDTPRWRLIHLECTNPFQMQAVKTLLYLQTVPSTFLEREVVVGAKIISSVGWKLTLRSITWPDRFHLTIVRQQKSDWTWPCCDRRAAGLNTWASSKIYRSSESKVCKGSRSKANMSCTAFHVGKPVKLQIYYLCLEGKSRA